MSIIINIVLALLLFPKYGIIGLAISTSLSSWVNLFLLINKLKDSTISIFLMKLDIDLLKIIIASFLMSLIIYFCSILMIDLSGILFLSILILTGVISYFLILFLLCVLSKNDIPSIIRNIIF